MSLTPIERNLLKTLQSGPRICRTNPPSERVQSLVARGYVRLSKALCGPLAAETGEVIASLTEAGRAVIAEQRTTAEENSAR